MSAERRNALLIVAGVFALDRATKLWIEAKVGQLDTIEVIPGIFNIVYTRNRGAAFGLLQTAPEWLRLTVLVGLSVVILGLIAGMLWQATRPAKPGLGKPGPAISRWALALVMGGAMGNLWDRVLAGSVTDFLQVFLGSYEWPSFNVADSAISVGAVLMAIDLLRNKEQAAPAGPAGSGEEAHAPEAH